MSSTRIVSATYDDDEPVDPALLDYAAAARGYANIAKDYRDETQQGRGDALLQAGNAAASAAAAQTSRLAAEAARTTAEDHAEAAAADREAVALDRAAVAADRTAVANDRNVAAAAAGAVEGVETLAQGLAADMQQTAAAAALAQIAAGSAVAVSQTDIGASVRIAEYSTTKIAALALIAASREVWNADAAKGPVGDWRDKVAGVSWMNEALGGPARGAQARFPAMGAVSFTATALTVHNFDGAGADVWKVWTIADAVCNPAYAQGMIFYGTASAVHCIDLILDRVTRRTAAGLEVCLNHTAASYNQTSAVWAALDAAGFIAAGALAWISAGVVPTTPVNALRGGLPNPTVAIEQSGGGQAFRHDGARMARSGAFKSFFGPDGLWAWQTNGLSRFGNARLLSGSTSSDFNLLSLLGVLEPVVAAAPGAWCNSTGLRRFVVDEGNPAASLHARISDAFNTGYMHGPAKFALAESIADLTDMTGGALADRSPGGNAMTVTGTLTRAAVAGGELAGVKNFAANRHAQVAHTAALAFAAGDMCAHMTVVHGATQSAAQKTIFDYADPAGTGAWWRLELNASGYPKFTISDGANTAVATGAKALPVNSVARIAGLRRTATGKIALHVFVDGEAFDFATASAAAVGSLTNTAAVLRMGCRADGSSPFDTAFSLFTLGGVSPSAPLPALLARAAADEYPMHAPGAKVCLQGGSNVVALSRDPGADIVYASKASGGTDRVIGLVNAGALSGAGGVNRLQCSIALEVNNSLTRCALGAREYTGPANWGVDRLAWPLLADATAANSHYAGFFAHETTSAEQYVLSVPLKAGAKSWVWLTGVYAPVPSMFVNLATGATSAAANATALPSVDLGDGWWLAQFVFVATASTAAFRVYAADASGDYTFDGDGGAAPLLKIGKPVLRKGSAPLAAGEYVYPLSGSASHKAAAATESILAILTSGGVDQFLSPVPLRRELASVRPRIAYDPAYSEFQIATTDATATALAAFLVPEGRSVRFRAEVEGVMYGGAATERAVYSVQGLAWRDIGGNIAVSATTTVIEETTGTMDCIAQAQTTPQHARILVTGKAATRMVWRATLETFDGPQGRAV